MSIEVTLTPPDPAKPEPSANRPNSRRWLVAAAVLLVLATCSAGAWWWRNHPEQSFSSSYGIEAKRQAGEPLWTVLAHWNHTEAAGVTIKRIEPELGVNSSDARVEYVICELRQETNDAGGYESFGYGMHANRVDQLCASTRPAEGADLELRPDRPEELLVSVTPARPGRTVIHSHHISFDAGWQRGSDEIEVEISVMTPMQR